jgi:hypothetical protein
LSAVFYVLDAGIVANAQAVEHYEILSAPFLLRSADSSRDLFCCQRPHPLRETTLPRFGRLARAISLEKNSGSLLGLRSVVRRPLFGEQRKLLTLSSSQFDPQETVGIG